VVTVTVTTPGASGYGAYAGANLKAALADRLDLVLGADGTIRNDGLLGGSAKAGLAGTF
jgi:hypothetical protein